MHQVIGAFHVSDQAMYVPNVGVTAHPGWHLLPGHRIVQFDYNLSILPLCCSCNQCNTTRSVSIHRRYFLCDVEFPRFCVYHRF